MINSLRLLGHNQRVVVLDRGLNKRQRKLLGAEVELVTLPPAMQVTNFDSDLLVTRRLDPVFEAATGEQGCLSVDSKIKRWFPEWERILKLPYRPRRQPYIDAGFLDFSQENWPHLLPSWLRLLTGTAQIAIDLQYSQEKAE
jgi:hypothetical protein